MILRVCVCVCVRLCVSVCFVVVCFGMCVRCFVLGRQNRINVLVEMKRSEKTAISKTLDSEKKCYLDFDKTFQKKMLP